MGVNNKGQTPSSLASNHLDDSTCLELYTLERKQLQQYIENNSNKELTSSFMNYRVSNSDNELYGDLDPRFITKNDVNYQDDIKDIMMQYWQQRNESIFLNPTVKSIRVTTIESRTNYYDKKSRFQNLTINNTKNDEIPSSSSKVSTYEQLRTNYYDTNSNNNNNSFSNNLIVKVMN